MFVKAMDGSYYPVALVERLWEETSGDRTVQRAAIRDVGIVELFYAEVRRITEETASITPCNGGFYVLGPVGEEDGSTSLEKIPVLGWALTPDRGVLPITIEGINNNDDAGQPVPILYPSGEVVLAMDCVYPSEQAYLEKLNTNV